MPTYLPFPALLAAALTASSAADVPPHPVSTPLACKLSALSSVERARHADLLTQLHHAVVEHRELPNGVALRLDPAQLTLAEVGEWASLEHRCCPFLRFDLSVEAEAGPIWLSLTGPAGTRELLGANLAG